MGKEAGLEVDYYYTCGLCSVGDAVPAFHWEGEHYFDWHRIYAKEKSLQILESGELQVTYFENRPRA